MSDGAPLVLVVEDDFEIREALLEILALSGYRTEGAANGREALDLLASGRRPCLILLDLMMPVMDAWGFREQQLQSEDLRDIPVVVVTAYPDPQGRAARLDAAAHLSKPVDLDLLIGTVERFCRA